MFFGLTTIVKNKRVLSARDGMLYKEFYKVQKRVPEKHSQKIQPLLFIFICEPDFAKAKKFHTTQYFIENYLIHLKEYITVHNK